MPLDSSVFEATRSFNQRAAQSLLPLDGQDFEAARRGHLADLPTGGVLHADGKPAWDRAWFDFLQGACPPTVNPSLWRHAQLNAIGGLFEVTDGVWQVRACDYANMTIIRGQSGWIVVDPLIAEETAAAALALVNETLGERPVSAVLVTHPHADHFGGLGAVVPDRGGDGIDGGDNIPIYVPKDFMLYAATEAVLGGNHTSRRAIDQFGLALPFGPEGAVDGGIGKTVARGKRGFRQPTHEIDDRGQVETIDGVAFEFLMASGTEAPAEFTFFLPEHQVLCMAEVCTQTQHNLLTPRGAEVRDARLWSKVIDRALLRFGDRAETLINCHNWPVWGAEAVTQFLLEQRDIYKYIHDQSLRLANHGLSQDEVGAALVEPDFALTARHVRGFYGMLSFNARAVYQKYYGAFDGRPLSLRPLPPEAQARRYLQALGGAERVVTLARDAIEADDLDWAASLLNHVVFGTPTASGEQTASGEEARLLLAQVYRNLGYRAESGIERNIYLAGAQELEQGVTRLPAAGGRNNELAATLPLEDWLDAYAVRLNPERARGVDLSLVIEADGAVGTVQVARQTEFARAGEAAKAASPDAVLSVRASRDTLEALMNGHLSLEEAKAAGLSVTGDESLFIAWLDLHDQFDLWFNIATP